MLDDDVEAIVTGHHVLCTHSESIDTFSGGTNLATYKVCNKDDCLWQVRRGGNEAGRGRGRIATQGRGAGRNTLGRGQRGGRGQNAPAGPHVGSGPIPYPPIQVRGSLSWFLGVLSRLVLPGLCLSCPQVSESRQRVLCRAGWMMGLLWEHPTASPRQGSRCMHPMPVSTRNT